jgi:hypothetical protein
MIESTYTQVADYRALRVNQHTGSSRVVHHRQTVGTHTLGRGRGLQAATTAGYGSHGIIAVRSPRQKHTSEFT